MITVKDAIERIQKKHPEQRILSGLDMGTFYAFWTLGRSVNPTSVPEIPVGSTMQAIRKNNGEEFPYSPFHSEEGTPKGGIDITPYLSSDDAAFAKKIRKMIENGV